MSALLIDLSDADLARLEAYRARHDLASLSEAVSDMLDAFLPSSERVGDLESVIVGIPVQDTPFIAAMKAKR